MVFKLVFLLSLIFNCHITTDFHCTGGKDPSKIGNKNSLLEFSKSPCSPLLLIPGI